MTVKKKLKLKDLQNWKFHNKGYIMMLKEFFKVEGIRTFTSIRESKK